jgi:hypothetical protein
MRTREWAAAGHQLKLGQNDEFESVLSFIIFGS